MSQEIERKATSGWGMLGLNILLYPVVITIFIFGVVNCKRGDIGIGLPLIIFAVLLFIGNFLITVGFMILQPNEAGVLLLFGKYKGSVKDSGFWWLNPFYTKKKISLRLRNLNTEKIKVNDKSGNPIEVATVLVWKVEDTFAACFEVDDYIDYVDVQSEAALRYLASNYPYDSWEDHEVVTLRGNIDEVSEALEKQLQERLDKAGVLVKEARISHLAYAQEIAEAMLRRQQASAIVAARQKIVEGAVGMVRMALDLLKEDSVVELDEERKAAMVSNLLVVLCGETNAQPVVNAGTLYT